eukprot:c26452_g1_i3 orf=871-1413(+)
MSAVKITKLYQIVKLRKMLKKWQRLVRLERTLSQWGISVLSPTRRHCRHPDQEEFINSSPPFDVPEGYLAVYVGNQRRRFVIKIQHLNQPLFQALLAKVEEEFGFNHEGGLTIPCAVAFFEHLLWLLEKKDPATQSLQLQMLAELYSMDMQDCSSDGSLLDRDPFMQRTGNTIVEEGCRM